MSKYESSGKTPLARFKQQRWRALARGIEWELTFDEWLSIWTASGHFAERGKRAGQYVMGRKGDICLFTQNIKDAFINNPHYTHTSVLGTGRGWTYRAGARKPYQVVVSKKYIGVFATQHEAEAAYRAGVRDRHESLSVR